MSTDYPPDHTRVHCHTDERTRVHTHVHNLAVIEAPRRAQHDLAAGGLGCAAQAAHAATLQGYARAPFQRVEEERRIVGFVVVAYRAVACEHAIAVDEGNLHAPTPTTAIAPGNFEGNNELPFGFAK